MGCGALCGDTTTLDNTITRKSKIAFERVLQELRENRQLISTEPYSSFLTAYQIAPEEFLFKNRPKLIKNDVVTPQILIKWKLILFGRDHSDQNYRQCLALTDYCEVANQQAAKGASQGSESTIVYHQSFIQIEKDIQRTFDVPIDQAKKKQFENVLKRITNHFPKMGYTQGLNFIVSHLLVIGYSQKDSFQLFVHLAINKRYLFLGLYEEGFPLYYIFLKIFENLLKRLNLGIYEHLFQNLMMDPSMWICQWFMTFFVYSFPKELVKYIFDMILVIGNLGMVLFATSLILQLSPFLVEKNDIADVGEFLKSLKDPQKFNQYVNFQNVVSKVYEIQLVIEDFNQVEGVHNFYGIYIKTAFKANSQSKRMKSVDIAAGLLNKYHQQAEKMHQDWLKAILSERKQFKQMNRVTKNVNYILEIQSGSKSNEQIQINNEDLQQIIFQVNKPQTDQTQSTFTKTKIDFNVHPSNKIEYVFNRIKQKIEEEQQSVNSKASYKKSKNSRSIKQQQLIDLEELDKLQLEFKQKKTNLVGAIIHPVRNNFGLDNEKGSIYVSNFNDNNSLSLAGKISIKNDNSYDAISVCSKHNSNRSRLKNSQTNNKAVISKNPRICGCKTKTQENNRLSNAEQSSELTESKYSDKDSISNKNYSQTQQVMNELGMTRQEGGTHRERSSTREDYMINSHGPNMNDKNKIGGKVGRRSETDIEVVIPQVFKKDKRARVNLVSPTYFPKKEQKLFNIGWEQESIESINQGDKLSQVHSIYSGNQCEIESIK